MEAYFVASLLNGNDVPAFVLDDNVCRMLPQMVLLVGGSKVVVSPENVEIAWQTLEMPETGELFLGQCVPIPMSDLTLLIRLLKNWLKRRRQAQDSLLG